MSRGWGRIGWTVAVVAALSIAWPAASARAESSSSRPISPTVVATYVTRNDQLILLVLWRGSPGWFAQGNGHAGSGGGGGAAGGHQYGSVSLTYGGKSFAIEFDYTDGVAHLLDTTISLSQVNLLLVDGVDGPSGARIVRGEQVDPLLPSQSGAPGMESDPVLTVIRRRPDLKEFLQCDVVLPLPPELEARITDPAARARVVEYVQNAMMLACRQDSRP